MLGFGYTAMLSVGDVDESASEFNTFRIQFGAGADFNITEQIFLRGMLLGAWHYPPQIIRDGSADYSGGFGAGIRLAVGFRL